MRNSSKWHSPALNQIELSRTLYDTGQGSRTSSVKRTRRLTGFISGSRRCEHPDEGSTHAMRTVCAATEPEHVRTAQPAAGVMSAMADGEADHYIETSVSTTGRYEYILTNQLQES